MYKCHLCDLQSKQINILIARHANKHCSDTYTKAQYKVDLLANNGRRLNDCKMCGQPVPIPKGESESPKYHKQCYLKTLNGKGNPNYRGGPAEFKCPQCNKKILKHNSIIKMNLNTFCSTSCAQAWYGEPENRTDTQKENDIASADMLRELRKSDKTKAALAKAQAKMQKDKASRLEIDVLQKVKNKYPLVEHQVLVDFYTVDLYVPEIDTYLDVHGNYWHNKLKHQSGNQRKRKFFNTKGLRYLELWGNELDLTNDPVTWASKPINLHIVCGPSGSGKSWLASNLSDQYEVIDMDKLGFDGALAAAEIATKPTLVVINMQATRFVKLLAEKDIRVTICTIIEDEATIRSRLAMRNGTFTPDITKRMTRYASISAKLAHFSGTQAEVTQWLRSK